MEPKKQDGSVDIPLSKPIKIDGAPIKSLRMREPTVGDHLAASKGTSDAAEQELAMVANLCMVTTEDLKQLSLRDYRRVQAALVAFIE
jgi:hypothetical protein